MFKINIHYFRGISIIFIVFSHCYFCGVSIFGQNQHFFNKILISLISGCSSFFVFISGFLFNTIYKSNIKYFDFLLNKIRFVYLPFIIFISFDLLYLILMIIINSNNKSQFYSDTLFNINFINVYFGGKSFITSGILWYVPFIMFIYLLSPVFLFYSRLRADFRFYILFLSLMLSLFLFRGKNFDFLSTIHNVIYFLPFYLLGILSSQFEFYLYKKINKINLLFLILLSFGVAFISNYPPFLFLTSFDLILFQKVFFCIVFLVSLKSLNPKKLEIIKILATNSFGIFFIHPIIIYLVGYYTTSLNIIYKNESFFIYLIIATIVLFISLFVVLIIKRILGKRSKYFIGV